MRPMVCHECGREVEPGARFCNGCGTRLDDAARADDDAKPAIGTEQGSGGVTPPSSTTANAADSNSPHDDGPHAAPFPPPPPHSGSHGGSGARIGEPSDGPGTPHPTARATPGGEAGAEDPIARPSVATDTAASDTDATHTDARGTDTGTAHTDATDVSATDPRADDPAARSATATDTGGDVHPDTVAGDDDDPVWAVASTSPIRTAYPSTSELPETEPITEVRIDPITGTTIVLADEAIESDPTPYDFTLDDPDLQPLPQAAPVPTMQVPVIPTPVAPQPHGFRIKGVTILALIGAGVTLASVFATILTITSDVRLTPLANAPVGFRTGTWIADDLAGNLSIAGLVAALAMAVGGVAAGFGWRWGSGLAGGGGLAFAGVAALTVGLAQMPIDAAHDFAAIPSEQVFTITITRDAGYWMLIAAGAVGLVLFFASLSDAVDDRRPGLNPWIAALGALAAVITAAGPLIPENRALFSDNWFLVDAPGEAPALLLVGRIVQLALLAFAGVFGFLLVRRYGLGLAVGGTVPVLWMAVSTLFDLTVNPVGPGWRNPGATDMHLHGVTIIGSSALAAMLILAVVAAYDQDVRERS